MVLVRCSDELVIGCVERVADTFYLPCNLVNIFFRCYAGSLGVFFNFLAVLIGSGEHKNVIAAKALIARDCIGQHNFIAVADMRFS